jgi:hypothetical protein
VSVCRLNIACRRRVEACLDKRNLFVGPFEYTTADLNNRTRGHVYGILVSGGLRAHALALTFGNNYQRNNSDHVSTWMAMAGRISGYWDTRHLVVRILATNPPKPAKVGKCTCRGKADSFRFARPHEDVHDA